MSARDLPTSRPPGARPPEREPRAAGGAALLAALGLASLLCWLPVALAGRRAAFVLAYERGAVLRGELWRLVTAHFVHFSGLHLFWNLVALAALAVLFGRFLGARAWTGVTLASALTAGLGVLAFEPTVAAMAGLSGVLHGLAAAGAVAAAAAGRKTGLAMLVVLGVKLAAEQVAGPLPFASDLPGGGVAVAAHLYGAAGGLAAALAATLLARRRASP